MRIIKASVVVLLIMILACFSACKKKEIVSDVTISDANTISWQNQYDLGIRLLAEGKYEDAIIAFEAAIQIDPKRADAYLQAYQAYLSAGDEEKAIEVLKKGISVTGDSRLQDLIQDMENEDTNEQQTAKLDSPFYRPTIPGVLLNDHTRYEYNYLQTTEEMAAMFTQLVQSGVARDIDKCYELLTDPELVDYIYSVTGAVTEEIVDELENSGRMSSKSGFFWSQWNESIYFFDFRIIDYHDHNSYYISYEFDYRPANGEAFYVSYSGFSNTGLSYSFLEGKTVNYLYQGDYKWITTGTITDADYIYSKTMYGSANEELLNGEQIVELIYETADGEPVDQYSYHAIFDNGILMTNWQDENGINYALKRVRGSDVFYSLEPDLLDNLYLKYYLRSTQLSNLPWYD